MERKAFIKKSAVSLIAAGFIIGAIAQTVGFQYSTGTGNNIQTVTGNIIANDKTGVVYEYNSQYSVTEIYQSAIFNVNFDSDSGFNLSEVTLKWSDLDGNGNFNKMFIFAKNGSENFTKSGNDWLDFTSDNFFNAKGQNTVLTNATMISTSSLDWGIGLKNIKNNSNFSEICNDTYTVTIPANSLKVKNYAVRGRNITPEATLTHSAISTQIQVIGGANCEPSDIINLNNQTANDAVVVEFDKEERPSSTTGTIKSKEGDTSVIAPASAIFTKVGSSISTIMKTENGINQILTSASGEVNANMQFGNKEVEIKVPAGSTAKMSESGEFKVVNTVEVDGKEVKSAIVVDKDGKVKVTAKLPNGKIKEIRLKRALRNPNIEILAKGFVAKYRADKLKLQFPESTAREAGETVEIVGTSDWQRFEESQNFDGARTIKLIVGKATISRDGSEPVPMVTGQEYEIPSEDGTEEDLNILDGDNTTPTTPEVSNKLSLVEKWNLVSLPTDKKVTDLTIFGDYSKIYAYNGQWSSPTELNANEGFWINMNKAKEITFEGNNYTNSLESLNDGWNLLGTGDKLENIDSSFTTYIYNPTEKVWTKNPTTINSGQGFWLKK